MMAAGAALDWQKQFAVGILNVHQMCMDLLE
jgi:hypothetical protein